MTLSEYYDRQIPNYYDGMHRDGYTADQILYALRRQMVRSHYERQEAEQAAAEQNEVWNVKIVSEVKIK